tara:strand:- start:4752 stop:5099 length:348 start_codon:yes stop_codon:yes gene_type:complete
MGRYYSGDIEGKFMFAVQSSDAADRFGVAGNTPGHISYYFDEDQIPTIEEQLKVLQPAYDKVSKFFEDRQSYTDEMLREAGISSEELSDYADYDLGKKILDCIKEEGSCEFDAEL